MFGLLFSRELPLKRILPEVGFIRPAISDKTVVFPHPDGPIIAVIVFSLMFKFILSSANVSCSRV